MSFKESNLVLELKMKHQEKIQNNTFDELFVNSLGIEHFAIAFKDS
jgi:hypothetical protein